MSQVKLDSLKPTVRRQRSEARTIAPSKKAGFMLNKNYSSLSQTKGLLWREWFDGILTNDFLPPVGAVIDLTNMCNLGCHWCNARFFRSPGTLETDHVKEIIDMLSDWGVKSVCYAGGGEPSLHSDFAGIVEHSTKKGLEVGISTNGTNLDKQTIKVIAENARFCGFSIDAGTEKTWRKLKGSGLWSRMLKNAYMLGEYAKKTRLDFSYKFLIVPENQYEIPSACRLAQYLGFKTFFVRPAAYENVPGLEDLDLRFDVDAIRKEMDECLSLERGDFRVYGSFGRVSEKLGRTIRFSRCTATPLMAVFCADGWCYLCIDRRGRGNSRLCKHLELRNYWNSREHDEMIEKIDLEECPRCAFGHYNEQLEAYAVDYMFKWFP